MIRIEFRCDGTSDVFGCTAVEVVGAGEPSMGQTLADLKPRWLTWVGNRLLCLRCAEFARREKAGEGMVGR